MAEWGRRGRYDAKGEGGDELTGRVIGAAIEVHRAMGPGLLESVYHACLREEFARQGMSFAAQVSLPIMYRGKKLPEYFRLDFVVESDLVVEIKSIDRLAPLHLAQLLTYLRLGSYRRGLLINFNVERLTLGVRRVILDPSHPLSALSASALSRSAEPEKTTERRGAEDTEASREATPQRPQRLGVE